MCIVSTNHACVYVTANAIQMPGKISLHDTATFDWIFWGFNLWRWELVLDEAYQFVGDVTSQKSLEGKKNIFFRNISLG